MSIVNRLPWLAIALLLFSFSTLGWVLSDMRSPLFVWLIVVLTIFFFLGAITAPYLKISDYSNILFGSSLRSFLATIVGALLFFIMIAWFRVFLDMLLIVAAIVLAKIDFQSSRFREGQAFVMMFILSIAGVALGALINMIFKKHLLL